MTKQQRVANEIYENLTDYVHEGNDSIGVLNNLNVESVDLNSDNEITIELENGDKVVLTTKYISK